jgi:spore coat protein U-like protein
MIARLLLACVLFMLALAAPEPAEAQTCTITRPSIISFGTVDVLLNAAVDITATIGVRCTGVASRTVRVCLNLGDPNGGTVGGLRIARSGTNNLSYQLYSDPARTVKWSSWKTGGVGVEVLVPIGPTGTSSTINTTMYGRVFAGQQTARVGTYNAAFSGTFTHRSQSYTTTGTLCPALTAGTATWGFTARAIVQAKCVLSSAAINFGAPTGISANIDASTNLSLACSSALPYQLQLNGGVSGATDPTFRRMTKGAEFVRYGLYRNATRTQPWGSTLGTNTVSGTGTGLTVSVPVYGRVPVQATPSPGTYTDTVVVTVNY